MGIVIAKLIKRVTSDGLMSMGDQVSLGKEYQVKLNTKQFQSGFNYIKKEFWRREMIEDANGGWLPTELLQWEGKDE